MATLSILPISRKAPARKSRGGFTVIEMLVVMTAVALLLSVIAPVYVRHIDRAREVALRQDLRAVRDALDKFFADQGRYPAGLHELVATKYLRALPMDPMTERTDTWVLVPASEGVTGIRDLRSGASGRAQDGTLYAQW